MKETDEKPVEKKQYNFGKVEKVTVESSDLEVTVFALADAWPGDGCDPRCEAATW